ncbi:adenylate/guanylate cyclase domain-containing protein [Falsiroseomonas oryzae]|uniref:adenylate/guanylate cyclase domain-containing protein n=1 Tax=Falsiroseomonas oryzae TaxID=2766473 RepID=UPI0022EB4703|nr:adenylate/guanylate cyclase domain-containing protein [Roseomonas sp. MO-31]
MDAEPGAAPRSAQLAILFADVAGSTRLYETLGDVAARDLIAGCLDRLEAATAHNGGTVVKQIGDEVMATFPSADAALLAASEMQVAVSGARVLQGRPLAVRIGLHFGPVLLEDDDVFGDAVNVAARLVAEAKGEQILTSAATLAAAGPAWRQTCRLVDIAAVRGRKAPVEIFESLWKAEDSTMMRHPPRLPPRTDAARLVLEAGAMRLELSEERPSATVGRGEQNDLVLRGPIVSRLHARVDFRRGHCVLTDQSTNGTWIQPEGGAPVFVRHDSHVLAGHGLIGFGEAPGEGTPTTVRYEVRAEA